MKKIICVEITAYNILAQKSVCQGMINQAKINTKIILLMHILTPCDDPINALIELEFEVLVFVEGRKPENPDKTLRARTRFNNLKLNPHVMPSLGIEPGPHWWHHLYSPQNKRQLQPACGCWW